MVKTIESFFGDQAKSVASIGVVAPAFSTLTNVSGS